MWVIHNPPDRDTDEGVGLDDVGRSLAEVREVHIGCLDRSQGRSAAANLVELLFARAFQPVDRSQVTYLPARVAILIRGEEADFTAGVTADTELISPVQSRVTARAHCFEERLIERAFDLSTVEGCGHIEASTLGIGREPVAVLTVDHLRIFGREEDHQCRAAHTTREDGVGQMGDDVGALQSRETLLTSCDGSLHQFADLVEC